MSTESECREKAAQARSMAKQVNLAGDRALWEAIAARWERLALVAEIQELAS
jgi:hypothetical protein